MSTATKIIAATEQLRADMNALSFADPVAYVYNPLDYAWAMHEAFIKRFATKKKKVIFLGMNPGPWGMSQTGIPFGEIPSVRDWMKLDKPITQPDSVHPKRPITGLACTRSEVSGRRLWGFFAERWPDPKGFFADHYVLNYCPLAFMEESGRNRTPDKLPADERAAIEKACDKHLRACVDILKPEWVVGVGGFARKRAEIALSDFTGQFGTVLHPSPASPKANRGWEGYALAELEEQGIW